MPEDAARIPDSADAAAWVAAGVKGFAESVLSFVPEGFPAYARLFHPAIPTGYRHAPPGTRALSWAEVAASRGTTAHPAMEWSSLIGTYRSATSVPPPPDHPGVEPRSGTLPHDAARPLIEVLRTHTGTPDRCFFAVWEGFGALSAWVREAPTFELPHRRYHLLAGPIDAFFESVEVRPFEQSPNLWWPEDRSWCVATEIDLDTTYIGASRRCVDALLGVSELEVLEVRPSDLGDKVNPAPADAPWLEQPAVATRRWRWRRGRPSSAVARLRAEGRPVRRRGS